MYKFLLFLSLIFSSVASAQPYSGYFSAGTVNTITNEEYNGVLVGSYNGTLTGNNLPNLINDVSNFWCVDYTGRFSSGKVVLNSFSNLVSINPENELKFINIARAIVYADSLATTSEHASIHEFIWNQFGTLPNWNLNVSPELLTITPNLNEFYLAEFDHSANGKFKLGGTQELAFRVNTTVVPEPSIYALIATGLAGIILFRKNK